MRLARRDLIFKMADQNTATAKKDDSTEVVDRQQVKNSPAEKNNRMQSRSRARREREQKEFDESVLEIRRVTRVNKGGRQLRFSVAVVIGDKKGRVGFAIGKSEQVINGIQKAIAKAKKNLVHVPIFDGTIPHEINQVFKASRVLLFPAQEGKGVIAGGAVRKILELAGIRDVLSKVHGSRNRINLARATMKALANLKNNESKTRKTSDFSKNEQEAPQKHEKEGKKNSENSRKTNRRKTQKKDES